MAFQMRFEVYRITEYKEGCVYKTEKVKDDLWLNVEERSTQKEKEIAEKYGGEILAPTNDTRIA